MSAPFPLAGEAAALASSLVWAGAGIGFRRLRGRVGPGALNLAKNAVAALGFAAVLLAATGAPWPTGVPMASLGWLALSGILGLAVCDTFLLRAMMEIGPRRATLFMSLAPVLIFAGALLPPFSQTASLARATTWAGAALALLGISLAASEAPDGVHDPADRARGIRDALIAAVLQAAGVLLARLGIEGHDAPVDAAFVRLLAGCAGLLVGGALLRRLGAWRREVAAPGLLRTIATIAFFGTFLGIGLNQCGIAWATSTGAVSTINSLAPVWLIPLSRAFLGERHGLRAWASTALALAGVALLSL